MAGGAAKKRKVEVSHSPKITDSRFASIQRDPRYRLPSKKQRVKLDKRFSRALQDDEFNRKAKVDRYGRPLDTDSEKTRLKRKYEFEEDEDEDEDEDAESDEPDDDDVVQRELKRADAEKKTRDLLREGRDDESSSSSDSSSEEEDSEEDVQEEAELAPQTSNDVPTGEVSSRLAVVNLDWDNIRAEDLMAVFSSFLDSGHKLRKVAVYPSEFGRERMQREEMEGPPKEIFASAREDGGVVDSDSEDEDDEAIKQKLINPDDGTADFDSQALRRYQLDRLRYFYAILTFSSPQAAKVIYDAVDGTEYLSTANFFDLRFVPDDTDFSNDTPRDECETISTNYKPNEFITDALQHSKVKLTWDAEDTNRKEAAARAFRTHDIKDLDDVDLAAYIGSDSSDNESVNDISRTVAPDSSIGGDLSTKKGSDRQKMRALLGLAPEPPSKSTSTKSKDRNPVGNVEVTFSAGLTSNSANPDQKRSVFENSPEPDETTIEKYVRKEKERKARRREKAKATREGYSAPSAAAAVDEDTAETKANNHFDDPSKTNKEDEDLGFDDPFFTAPSSLDASQQKSKLRKEERMKKRQEREAEEELNRKQRAQLELLMADDDDDDVDDASGSKGARGDAKKASVRHFDMREIAKEEKRARKAENRKGKGKGKKDKTKHRERTDDDDNNPAENANSTVDGGGGFTIDTKDPRFKDRLFGSHEFAIDPTNPRYGATKGMETLLEEGRRRKAKRHSGDQGGRVSGEKVGRGDHGGAGGGGGGAGEGGEGEDVRRLVEKIKKRRG